MDLKRRLVAGLLAAVHLACASGPSFTVAPTFTLDERGILYRAAERWNRIATDQISFDSGDEWHIVKMQPPGDPEFVGQTDARHRWIWIRPDVSPEALYAIALHEFGHSLGLQHLPDDVPGVMNPRAGSEFTAADMVECRRVGACQ